MSSSSSSNSKYIDSPYEWNAGALYFHKQQQCFIRNGCIQTGAHRALSQRFYPHYTFGQARSSSITPVQSTNGTHKRRRNVPVWIAIRMRQRARLPPSIPAAAAIVPTGLSAAIEAGNRFDDDLCKLMHLHRSYGITVSEVIDATQLTSLYARLKDKTQVKEATDVFAALSAATKALYQYLHSMDLRPCGAQVVCGRTDWGVATADDFIAYTTNKNGSIVYVPFENKMGYAHMLTGSGNRMQAPFDDMSDAPVNQWRLQRAHATLLLRATYPTRRFHPGVIFRYDPHAVSEVEKVCVEELTEDFVGRVARAMIASCTSRKRCRPASDE